MARETSLAADALVLASQLQRHAIWSVELLGVLAALTPLSYCIVKKIATKRKPQVVDGLTFAVRLGVVGDTEAQERAADYILALQRQSDDEFACNVAAWARRLVLRQASAIAKRRALAALDMCLGFLIVSFVDHQVAKHRNSATMWSRFVDSFLVPPRGWSLFAFFDFAAAAEFNCVIRLPLIQKLPEFVPLCCLASVTPSADASAMRRLPDELIVATCRSCSAGQLALWQLLVSSTPPAIAGLMREGIACLILPSIGKHSADSKNSGRQQPPSLLVRLQRMVVPSLLSSVAVYAGVTWFGVEGGRVASLIQRWVPNQFAEKGARYVLSCVASISFLMLLPKQQHKS